MQSELENIIEIKVMNKMKQLTRTIFQSTVEQGNSVPGSLQKIHLILEHFMYDFIGII